MIQKINFNLAVNNNSKNKTNPLKTETTNIQKTIQTQTAVKSPISSDFLQK